MSDASKPVKAEAPDHRLELTRTIKRLSMPTAHADRDDETSLGTALLLCTDAASRKWATRWLTQGRFDAQLPPDPQNAVAIARDIRPAVVIVESSLVDNDGTRLYQALLDAADLEMPVIVLCSGNKDLSDIMRADPYDVARKPFEWPLIALRAQHAVQHSLLQSRYANSRESLKQALDLADAARQRLRSRESFEPVTGLPNKRKFMELLSRGMAAVNRDGTKLAVVVIGFNRFRLVVEALGQDRADLMQTEIGNILTESLSRTDGPPAAARGLRTAAAASIDQFRFALMMTVSESDEELASLREFLLERLSRPIQVEGQMISLSACLGVALYPQDADDVDSLLQRADNAMRDAQSRGGGFKYYCIETDAAAARKLKLEHMLHEAIDRNELSLAYQPITEVSRGRVTAAEALLRWRQADGTFISPDEFVPVAEETGLMNRIGEFVVEEACKQLIAWRRGGIPMPRMCVNVSKVQLMSGDFVPAVRRILDKLDFDPSGLELELSERGVLSGDYDVVNQLHELKNLGIRLSIDDFGTGDSAIAYLKALPVDVLKIDRSYIAGLTDNEKDAAIVSAMVALGQRLGLIVVAEGVETKDQLAVLQKLGCDAFQGFLISQPVPGNTFVSLLQKPKPRAT